VRSIVILGAGELGGALARQLAAADITTRIILVDEAGSVAAGKALDIRQAAPVDGYVTAVDGTADHAVLVGADAIVIADQFAAATEWHDDAGVGLVRTIRQLNEQVVIVCAGARQLEMIARSVREIGVPRQRIVGSAPDALRSAIVSMTALEAGCSPKDVSLTVVGRPPHQIIVPWDDAAIAGRRAIEVLSPPALTRLDGRLARLWPPGPLALASAATRMLTAAATRGRDIVSAFVVTEGGEGERERTGMLPITVGPSGVTSVIVPSLSARDRVRLETAVQR